MAAQTQAFWQGGRVLETTDIARGIRRVVIAPERPARAAPGSHVDVLIPRGGGDDSRSYSVVDSHPDGSALAVSVRLAPRSRGGSRYLHELRPGDPVRLTQPLQNFPLHLGPRRFVLVAGGVGITAVAEMARTLQRFDADYTLVYAGRDREAMAYLPQLEHQHGPRLCAHVSAEGTRLDVARLVDDIADSGGADLYLCGPIPLMDAVRRRWLERGLPLVDLRYETFGNSGWFDPEEFTVAVPQLGLRVTVPAEQSMLAALEAAGVDMMADCRKGECGLCTVRVVAVGGRVDHRDVFFSDQQKTTSAAMCACVSRIVAVGTQAAVVTIEVP